MNRKYTETYFQKFMSAYTHKLLKVWPSALTIHEYWTSIDPALQTDKLTSAVWETGVPRRLSQRKGSLEPLDTIVLSDVGEVRMGIRSIRQTRLPKYASTPYCRSFFQFGRPWVKTRSKTFLSKSFGHCSPGELTHFAGHFNTNSAQLFFFKYLLKCINLLGMQWI